MAEDERHRIVKRANEGRVAARKRGAKSGRKPKLSDHQQAEVIKRMAAGESSGRSARPLGCIMQRSQGWRSPMTERAAEASYNDDHDKGSAAHR